MKEGSEGGGRRGVKEEGLENWESGYVYIWYRILYAQRGVSLLAPTWSGACHAG